MKQIYVIAIIVIFGILLISGCTKNITSNTAGNPVTAQTKASTVEKVEVYHFHGNRQCSSCIAVGKYAEETINIYFADELNSGKIVFAHVNIQLPENEGLAKKYGVTGSSLWIGIYDENGFHKEENVNVWYKISDEQEYINYLKEVLIKRLSGDYS